MVHYLVHIPEPDTYTFVPGLAKERKKRFSNKTKTGCDTCKRRRVKCDEGKPTCDNCNRFGRICEGYPLAAIDAQRRRRVSQHPKSNSAAQAQFPQQINLTYGMDGESQWLEKWFDNTAKELAKFSCPYFWYTLIPQVSWSHQSVRQALIAVAIICEESCSLQRKGHDSSKALYYYNESIRALTKIKGDKSASTDVVMLCCILFWIFENIENRPYAAITHLQAAVNILNEHVRKPSYQDDLLISYIEPVIEEGMVLANTAILIGDRHHRQALPTLGAYQDLLLALAPNLQPEDIQDARKSFAMCQEATMIAEKMARSRNSPTPDLMLLRDLYSTWKRAIDEHGEHWPKGPVRLLNMHYEMDMMAIDLIETELEGGRMQRDCTWRPRLQHLLSEARHFAKLATHKDYSTVHVPVITPLSFIARQCCEQDCDLANEALATLEEYEFFEGIWNSRVAAEVVRLARNVDIEHKCCNKR